MSGFRLVEPKPPAGLEPATPSYEAARGVRCRLIESRESLQTRHFSRRGMTTAYPLKHAFRTRYLSHLGVEALFDVHVGASTTPSRRMKLVHVYRSTWYLPLSRVSQQESAIRLDGCGPPDQPALRRSAARKRCPVAPPARCIGAALRAR
jgi:hypothetical protein